LAGRTCSCFNDFCLNNLKLESESALRVLAFPNQKSDHAKQIRE